jgi:hypothetical protein
VRAAHRREQWGLSLHFACCFVSISELGKAARAGALSRDITYIL